MEGVASQAMPSNTVATLYEGIKHPDGTFQKCVSQADLEEKLNALYAFAEKVKPKFDSFGRQLVRQLSIDADGGHARASRPNAA